MNEDIKQLIREYVEEILAETGMEDTFIDIEAKLFDRLARDHLKRVFGVDTDRLDSVGDTLRVGSVVFRRRSEST